MKLNVELRCAVKGKPDKLLWVERDSRCDVVSLELREEDIYRTKLWSMEVSPSSAKGVALALKSDGRLRLFLNDEVDDGTGETLIITKSSGKRSSLLLWVRGIKCKCHDDLHVRCSTFISAMEAVSVN